ncbi:MAG: SpoIIE family protein phosphatase [Coriobacteriales bacterium]|nr:SpoIIE family protein phosphatase [Coriobacteriales bacterium]
MEKKPKEEKRKKKDKKEKKEKGRFGKIMAWRGLLGDETRSIRFTVMCFLAIISATLTFMQLGFLGVGEDGSYLCYVSTLLFPIVIASLMLGRYWGVLMGCYSGAVLLLHAHIQPLDIFEQYFIGPLNSLGIYTFMGLVISIALAIALHNNVRGLRAAVYLLVTTLIISLIYSICYIVNLLVATAERLVEMNPQIVDSAPTTTIPYDSLKALASTGDPALQFVLNFALMFGMCLLAGVVVQQYHKIRERPHLRQVFRIRLFMILLCAFLITSAVSFVATTEQAKKSAHSRIDSEVGYVVQQIESRDNKGEALDALEEDYEIEDANLEYLRDSFALQNVLDGYTMDEDGTILIAENGEIVVSNNPAFEVGDSLANLYGPDGEAMFDAMAHEGKMLSMLYGKADTKDEDDSLLRMSSTQIGYAGAKETNGRYVMLMLPSTDVFAGRTATIAWMSLSALVLLLVMYLFASRLLTLVVVNEIDETNDSLAKITDGDLDELVKVKETDEFASLSEGINTTVTALKGWIHEAERRMEYELETAKAIQESALPRTFPPFPQIEQFDIYASMNAAKEVGGDFYDFFEIDDHTLGFLIADVSGKGVPASLFMMAAKTDIENYMSTGMDLAKAVFSANQRLCKGNDAGMFVTVWAATLDWQTGELTYCNAGHNFPLLRHGKGGEWEWLKKKCGLFLGTFETAKYRQETLALEPGDEIILYTDGVNEAFSADGEEYGNDRLEAFLGSHNDLHPRQLVEALRTDVSRWAEGAEQSDDITMLCLEYGVAPEVMDTMEVPATLDHLKEVTDPVLAVLDERLCPADIKHKVDVAIEELFVNVCRYAYADQDEPGMVRVSYTYTASPSTISVELVDQGVPFNPVTREDPTVPSNIQEAKIGGLGIFMVKKTMDDLSYRYLSGNNIVTFRISW